MTQVLEKLYKDSKNSKNPNEKNPKQVPSDKAAHTGRGARAGEVGSNTFKRPPVQAQPCNNLWFFKGRSRHEFVSIRGHGTRGGEDSHDEDGLMKHKCLTSIEIVTRHHEL